MLLDEGHRAGGWLPDDSDDPDEGPTGPTAVREVPYRATPPAEDAPDTGDVRSGLPSGVGRHRAPGPTPRWDPGRLGARSLW
ncbi:MAG: Competence protein ComEA, partial [Blastococcus sp.]|nr:Competence protein ComEA [Blastococcus sp.]